MDAVTIGAVTLGQSPRDDVVREIHDALPDVIILQCGALDGLPPTAIASLRPQPGDTVLVSRLQAGTEVKLAEHVVHARLQACVTRLETECRLILVLCTAELPALSSSRPLLLPSRLLADLVRGLHPRRLGVVTPAVEQVRAQRARLAGLADRVVVEVVSPYAGGDVSQAAEALARAKVDAAVLDCIGYTTAMRTILEEALRCPVLLPSLALGRRAREILEAPI